MKKSIFLATYVFLAALLFSSCSYEEDFTPPNYITFGVQETDFTVEQGGSGSFEVMVYTANIVGSDRQFEIMVDESSTVGTSVYNIPSTVTIPANSNEASFQVEVKDDNLDNSGGTLILELETSGDLHTGEPLTVNIFKFCPIDIQEYIGVYSGDGSWSAFFGYPTEVEIFENEDGELMINGLAFQWFQDWWGEVIVKNEPVQIEINQETGEINIPEQFYIESTYDGDLQAPYNIKGTGRIQACEQKVIINPVLVQGGTEIDGTNWDGGIPFVETIFISDNEPTEEE